MSNAPTIRKARDDDTGSIRVSLVFASEQQYEAWFEEVRVAAIAEYKNAHGRAAAIGDAVLDLFNKLAAARKAS